MEQVKFSAAAYSGKLRAAHEQQSAKLARPAGQEAAAAFQRLVEETRGFLVQFNGITEDQKMRFTELLNRAVLGFADERRAMLAAINDFLLKKRVHDPPPKGSKYNTLAEALFAEVIGLNVLELILKDKADLEEIQVVGSLIYEVRKGSPQLSAYQFGSLKEVERIQQNLVLFNNDTINPKKKWAEVMLRDGSRVTMTGFGFTSEPTLTIRFFTMRHFELTALCSPVFSTINDRILMLLRCLISACFNIVIIGATNTGKTNLIKALIAAMPDHEKLVTIESRLELQLKRDFPHKNVIEYEIDDDDALHSGRQAFKLALRQSPKRICHAEIRDTDANIYVRACTRGHDGSLTSVHVNTLEDAPEAITDMCMLDGRGMDPGRLTKRITEYVTQFGIEMAIVGDSRKIVRIGEFRFRNGEVDVHDIVRYSYEKDDWDYPRMLSQQASYRLLRKDPVGYRMLADNGMVEPCT